MHPYTLVFDFLMLLLLYVYIYMAVILNIILNIYKHRNFVLKFSMRDMTELLIRFVAYICFRLNMKMLLIRFVACVSLGTLLHTFALNLAPLKSRDALAIIIII